MDSKQPIQWSWMCGSKQMPSINLHPHKNDTVAEKWAKNKSENIISFHAEYTHAKTVSHKREAYQNKPRIYVLFVFELDDKWKIIKTKHQQLKKCVLYSYKIILTWLYANIGYLYANAT